MRTALAPFIRSLNFFLMGKGGQPSCDVIQQTKILVRVKGRGKN